MTVVDVALLPALDLDSVDRRAALQTRTDRKYVTDAATVERLVAGLDAHVLEIDGRRTFGYASTYFDTPDRQAYLAAARRRPGRWKVRTRTYLHDGSTWLEVKRRDPHGRTVKQRIAHLDPAEHLGGDALAFIGSFPAVAPHVLDLAPALSTAYERTTLVLDAGRVTIDRDVRCATPDGRLAIVGGVVVETKSDRAGSSADRMLWSMGVRPVTISKYGVGMAALHPGLPANKWHRTLQRHVSRA